MSANGAASALAWWHEAGVDTILDEAPRDWLDPAPARAPPTPAAAGAPPAPLPETLAELQAWLLAAEELPYASPTAPRAGPAGNPESGLMVLVDMPSPEAPPGALLAGEAGALFDRMMAAIGRDRESLYLAPLSPVRSPAGTIEPTAAAALAQIARHHVGLVRPRALLMFGDACARALLGGAVAKVRGRWHEIDTPTGPVRALATFRPDNLLAQPAFRKKAWEDLQLLREGLKP